MSISTTSKTIRTARAGQAMIEMMIATLAIIMIVSGLIMSIQAQGNTAIKLGRDARVRHLLSSEMAYLRGQPGKNINACKQQIFTPALGVHASLKEATFRRTITLSKDGTVAQVMLVASFPKRIRSVPLRLESTILRPAQPEETK